MQHAIMALCSAALLFAASAGLDQWCEVRIKRTADDASAAAVIADVCLGLLAIAAKGFIIVLAGSALARAAGL